MISIFFGHISPFDNNSRDIIVDMYRVYFQVGKLISLSFTNYYELFGSIYSYTAGKVFLVHLQKSQIF